VFLFGVANSISQFEFESGLSDDDVTSLLTDFLPPPEQKSDPQQQTHQKQQQQQQQMLNSGNSRSDSNFGCASASRRLNAGGVADNEMCIGKAEQQHLSLASRRRYQTTSAQGFYCSNLIIVEPD
jgi:hypothetical protein